LVKVIAASRDDRLMLLVSSRQLRPFVLSVTRSEEFGFPQPTHGIGSGKPRANAGW